MAVDPPYRLDPFQTIVNVHWGAFTHISLLVVLSIEQQLASQPCGGLPPRPADQLDYAATYLTQSNYAHDDPARPVRALFGRTAAGLWQSLTLDQVTVAGMPDPAAGTFAYSAYQKVAGTLGNANDGVLFTMSGPEIRLQAPISGSDVGIDVPLTGDAFKSGSSLGLEHFGDIYLSNSPEYCQGGGIGAVAKATGSAIVIHQNASAYSEHTMDFAGLTCRISETEFDFAGLFAKNAVSGAGFFNTRVLVNILTARQP